MNKELQEKLEQRGVSSLTDDELLRLISRLSSVTVQQHEIEASGSLDSIKLEGTSIAGKCSLLAALEYGRRRYRPSQERKITVPSDIYSNIRHFAFQNEKQEKFITISLNGAFEIINIRVVTVGLLNRTLVAPREVFSDILLDRAAACFISHSHPSGRLSPSEEDYDISRKLVDAGKLLGIAVLDHIIFSTSGFYSMKEMDPEIFE